MNINSFVCNATFGFHILGQRVCKKHLAYADSMPGWLTRLLTPHVSDIQTRLAADVELRAYLSSFLGSTICFALRGLNETGVNTGGGDVVVNIGIPAGLNASDTVFKIYVNDSWRDARAPFALAATTDHWQKFFWKKDDLTGNVTADYPPRPYQSFWGMLRVIGPSGEVRLSEGSDVTAFAQYARVWRRVLDVMRDVVSGRAITNEDLGVVDEPEEDSVVGRYNWVNHTEYGSVKVFHESAGVGDQIILFLHTAGSDSRQYHSLMNDKELQKKCTMYAFDLPAHGRSSLGTKQIPEAYALTEQAYIESISLVIEKLKLTRNDNLILCGASMAGHVCLAAAIQARKLGVRGVIPCEGCAHLPLSQPIYEMKGNDSAILDPERVCGMIAPMSPGYYKQQIWWQYSSQGAGLFAGDLKFYFKGWDGRGRLETIDTKYCPVYMLTGEYDYSCTTEASKATSDMIPGAAFEAMPKLGHFPLTENPKAVKPFLLKAMDHIQRRKV